MPANRRSIVTSPADASTTSENQNFNPWDIAAGALIVAEAGGTLSTFSGDQFTIWGDVTLASNGLIRDEMVHVASETASAHVD